MIGLIIALALETSIFSANALKLVSAVIVAITLSVPAIRKAFADSRRKKEARRHA